MIPKRVTVRLLEDMFACPVQVQRFKRYYPKGVELTPAVMTQAKKRGLDVMWFAQHMLYRASSPARYRYCSDRDSTPEEWLRAELKLRAKKAKAREKEKMKGK